MRKIHIIPVGVLVALIAYLGSAAAAVAMPPAPEPAIDSVATHTHPTVVHGYVSAWTYVLVAAIAVAVTLLVVALVRRSTTARPASQWAR
jgi:hypothetical protein